MNPFPRIFPLLILFFTAGAPAGQPDPVIGNRAPEFQIDRWINSKPIRLADLRGKVVLVRFWTDTCPYCSRSAPALRRFHEEYHEQGLVVIGLYHPKPPAQVPVERVRKAAERFGFTFPVGVDSQWKTLKEWWLKYPGKKWTSVSFLVDRKGIIRHVHRGGEYFADPANPASRANRDHERMIKAIELLLNEPA